MKRWPFLVPALLVISVPLVATSQDSFGNFDDFVNQMNEEFDQFTEEATAEYEAWVRADSLAFADFKNGVELKWGTFEGSTKKDWVEYSDDEDTRTVVDFDKGEARIEVLVSREDLDRNPQIAFDNLTKAVEKLVAERGKTMDYAVEDDQPQPLSEKPVLASQLANAEGDLVTVENAEAFSKEVVKAGGVTQEKVPSKDGTERIKATVIVPLVPNHLRVRAEEFVGLVREMSAKYHLDPRLVFAMIHTESFFNPKAKSPVPAYGLMQLVPTSGGRDAYNYVHKKDVVASPNFLYRPANNIELGCAYLDILLTRYFKKVQDIESRHYCAISAYNTGAGNVCRALTGGTKLKPAIQRINTMDPDDLLVTLKKDLPYEETRLYIAKILDRMKYYEEWGA